MNLRDENLKATFHKVLADVVLDMARAGRAAHHAELAEVYESSGVKSMDVRLPDGVKVATISLAVPQPRTEVVDADELLEHLEASGYGWLLREVTHDAVPEQVIPARPAYTEVSLDRDRLAEWLTAVRPVDKTKAGPVVDPDTGEVVPGVMYTPEGKPKSYSVRPTKDGRDEVLRAWQLGALDHLLAGSPLPALGAPTDGAA